MDKTHNNGAWLLVLPVFLLVAFSAIIPLMTVVNYAFQDIFGPTDRVWVGTDWFTQVLSDSDLHNAVIRQLVFSLTILAIEIPLGIALALAMPASGAAASATLVIMALPLLIPWNVVGTIWQIFARGDIGLAGRLINYLGINYNYTADPWAAWITIVVMDVWHWTPLVALLCYAGLRAIPPAYYQAASIDGASRWAVFRFIELPKMRGVLLIAVLLRFMDSFMIYTEPFVVTGGGPGSATTFLSIHLAKIAVGQFDLGPAAAISIVYFLIILTLSFVFYNVMTRVGTGDRA
ncbi:MAG: carbohydrate ABC transporter permease [Geminicoccaceae bacterium]